MRNPVELTEEQKADIEARRKKVRDELGRATYGVKFETRYFDTVDMAFLWTEYGYGNELTGRGIYVLMENGWTLEGVKYMKVNGPIKPYYHQVATFHREIRSAQKILQEIRENEKAK